MHEQRPTREGWYVDPLSSSRIRFHDGTEWTDVTMDPVTDEHPPLESGWYPDPLNNDRIRYFDGDTWTDEVETGIRTSAIPSDSRSRAEEDTSIASGSATGSHARRVPPTTAIIAGVAVLVVIGLVASVLIFVIPSRSGSNTDAADSSSQCVPSPTISRYRTEWTAAPRGYEGFEEKSQASLALADATVGLDPTLSSAAAIYAEALAGASSAWAADADNLSEWITFVSQRQGLLEDAIDRANVCK